MRTLSRSPSWKAELSFGRAGALVYGTARNFAVPVRNDGQGGLGPVGN